MSAKLVNVTSGEKLGDRQTFRITLEADSLGQLFNSAFLRGMQELYEALAATRLVYPISQPSALPGQQAAVIDVRVSSTGQNATVADMVRAIDQLPVFDNVFNVSQVQRTSTVPATSTTPAYNPSENSTTAAARRDQQQTAASDERKTQGLTGLSEQAARALKIVVVVALVGGALFGLVYLAKLRAELT